MIKNNNIKLLVLDVDGTLTDGGVYITEKGDEFKKFNTKDGLAIRYLTKNNFQVGIISASISKEIVKYRANMLGIQHLYIGEKNKLEILTEWIIKLNINFENVAYVGDDVNDLSVIQKVGLSACPADAVEAVKKQCHIILQRNGGDACVREFIEKNIADIG
jgi:3-deoxy-D-manno-octulosonate 8-phosphate phosphatase (KDO 8-P phosphatase)